MHVGRLEPARAASAWVLQRPRNALGRAAALVAAGVIAVAALSACGGGGSDGAPTPPSANQPGNAAPIANAGPPQNVIVASVVSLDGSASSDANGDPLTYSWTFQSRPVGSTTSLLNSTTARPAFIVDTPGTYLVDLVVNDGTTSSTTATITVNATTGNAAPVANAGLPKSVLVASAVLLNGSGSSDANGDPLSYAWAFSSKPTGSAAALADANTMTPVFVADLAGAYVVSLVVNDGKVSSTASSVTVTATTGNAVPVANAGFTQSVNVGSLVTLDGNKSSDANNDPLTYSWSFTSRPLGSNASLVGFASASPSFTPDVAGTFVLSLVVNDGKLSSTASAVTVVALAPSGSTANAVEVTRVSCVDLGPVDQTMCALGPDFCNHKWEVTVSGRAAGPVNSALYSGTCTSDASGNLVGLCASTNMVSQVCGAWTSGSLEPPRPAYCTRGPGDASETTWTQKFSGFGFPGYIRPGFAGSTLYANKSGSSVLDTNRLPYACRVGATGAPDRISPETLAEIDAIPRTLTPDSSVTMPNGQNLYDYLTARGIDINSQLPKAIMAQALSLRSTRSAFTDVGPLPSQFPLATGPEMRLLDVTGAMVGLARLYANKSNWEYPADSVGPIQHGLAWINGGSSAYSRQAPVLPSVCGENLYGLDCSGFIHQVARAANITIPVHTSYDQQVPSNWPLPKEWGVKVEVVKDKSSIKFGDIIFWDGHVGIATSSGSNPTFISSTGSENYSCVENKDKGPRELHLNDWVVKDTGTDPPTVTIIQPKVVLRLVVDDGSTCPEVIPTDPMRPPSVCFDSSVKLTPGVARPIRDFFKVDPGNWPSVTHVGASISFRQEPSPLSVSGAPLIQSTYQGVPTNSFFFTVFGTDIFYSSQNLPQPHPDPYLSESANFFLDPSYKGTTVSFLLFNAQYQSTTGAQCPLYPCFQRTNFGQVVSGTLKVQQPQ